MEKNSLVVDPAIDEVICSYCSATINQDLMVVSVSDRVEFKVYWTTLTA